jgi:hypothetical protein
VSFEGMNQPIPNFDTAVEQLRHFLGLASEPVGELLWVSSDDVITLGRRILVRWPLSDENEWLARETFEQGKEIGIGVCLQVVCRLEGGYCCNVWFVKDEEESAYRNCSGLKLSIPCELVEGEPIGAMTVWQFYSWRVRNQGDIRDFLPWDEGYGT